MTVLNPDPYEPFARFVEEIERRGFDVMHQCFLDELPPPPDEEF